MWKPVSQTYTDSKILGMSYCSCRWASEKISDMALLHIWKLVWSGLVCDGHKQLVTTVWVPCQDSIESCTLSAVQISAMEWMCIHMHIQLIISWWVGKCTCMLICFMIIWSWVLSLGKRCLSNCGICKDPLISCRKSQ